MRAASGAVHARRRVVMRVERLRQLRNLDAVVVKGADICAAHREALDDLAVRTR